MNEMNVTSNDGTDNNAIINDLTQQNFRLSKKVGELTQALDMMLKKAESGQFNRVAQPND